MARELLAKSYEPGEFEQKWYDYWEKKDFFKADNTSSKPRFDSGLLIWTLVPGS